MPTYVIGDVQGCFDDLMLLLDKIKFNSINDKLIFCGDLVNRGGQSIEVLRWIYAHQNCCQVTLGNHDLSLLAQYFVPQFRKLKNIEFQIIFKSSDCSLLMDWLLRQNILLHLKEFKTLIVHAGIYPSWSLHRAKKEAKRLESIMQSKPEEFFESMYGTKPNHWHKKLKGMDRARFIVNSFTRMRFLYKNGGLNFKAKGEIRTFPKLIPWFKYQPKKHKKHTIIFGHWSALGLLYKGNTICIDTGKVWGGQLTAIKLNVNGQYSQRIFQV